MLILCLPPLTHHLDMAAPPGCLLFYRLSGGRQQCVKVTKNCHNNDAEEETPESPPFDSLTSLRCIFCVTGLFMTRLTVSVSLTANRVCAAVKTRFLRLFQLDICAAVNERDLTQLDGQLALGPAQWFKQIIVVSLAVGYHI